MSKEILFKPFSGFWRHFVRPRRNLVNRYQSKWAVVTGASDGIGEAVCHQLAKSGLNIILVSRSEDKLNKVALDLKRHKVKTICITFDFMDLSSPEKAQKFTDRLDFLTQNRDIGILVNNVAAYFSEPMHNIFDMLHVNAFS